MKGRRDEGKVLFTRDHHPEPDSLFRNGSYMLS